LSSIYELFSNYTNANILKISYVASIYAGIFNAILKFIFNRQRPSIGIEPTNFFCFIMSNNKTFFDLSYACNSMPSGHTVIVFAAITPLFLYIKSSLYRFLILCFGIIIAIARVYTLNHWLSDVIVSVFLGTLVGLTIYEQNKYKVEA
jgi:membrane-associated phospholipid phosphatase